MMETDNQKGEDNQAKFKYWLEPDASSGPEDFW